MITEDYVSFETAKLLKEKGFNELTCGFYHDDYIETLLVSSPSDHNGSINSVCAPSLGHAMKWLREVHRLSIDIYVAKGPNWYAIVRLFDKFNKPIKQKYCDWDKRYDYKQACEAAIMYCLTNLI